MMDRIRSLLQEHGRLHTPVEQLSDFDDLYSAGLTPFAAIRTMLALEEAFDVEFPVSMLRRQSFASLSAVRDCVDKLLTTTERRAA